MAVFSRFGFASLRHMSITSGFHTQIGIENVDLKIFLHVIFSFSSFLNLWHIISIFTKYKIYCKLRLLLFCYSLTEHLNTPKSNLVSFYFCNILSYFLRVMFVFVKWHSSVFAEEQSYISFVLTPDNSFSINWF